jgi:hypothetical protein
MHLLAAVVGWSLIVIVDLLALAIVVQIARGAIDISLLLSEPGGGASLSRFQLLIFTYVIGLSLFWITISSGRPAFPEVTAGMLSLLGISASTYAVSKGLQMSGGDDGKVTVSLDRGHAVLTAGQSLTLTAMVGGSDSSVLWSVAPQIGSLAFSGSQAIYTAPAQIAAPATVMITAAVPGTSASATATVHLQ